jgi:IS30 family transposase
LKLEERTDEIRGYLAIGLSKRKMATALGVAYNTVARFIERKGLQSSKRP